jgi:sugar transferase (PEP-CTERM system associated)
VTPFSLRRVSWRAPVLIGSESALIIGAVILAAWLRLREEAWPMMAAPNGFLKAFLIALVSQVCLYHADLYDLRVVADRRELIVRTLQSLGVTSFILAALYFWFPSLIIGRGVFLVSALLVIVLVVGWRAAFAWLSVHARPRERLLLVGVSAASIELARELHDRREELGVEIVGFVEPDSDANAGSTLDAPVVGDIASIPAIVKARAVDRVVVSLSDARGKLPMDQLLEMRLSGGVRFDHLASVYEEYTGKIALENLRPSWLIFSEGFRKTRWLTAAKRAADVSLATVGLLLALPLVILVAVAIKITSAGPAFYHQQRVGQHGRLFMVHKFRSMRTDAEAATGAVWARPGNDPRVTPIGRLLRRTRLDELPQLWNVLAGDMSFVGPRPERPEFVADLTRDIPFYGQRHVVKPGVTGWAQIRYTYGATVEDAMQKLQYDLFYIKNLSLALDVFIVLSTIKTVLVRRGS